MEYWADDWVRNGENVYPWWEHPWHLAPPGSRTARCGTVLQDMKVRARRLWDNPRGRTCRTCFDIPLQNYPQHIVLDIFPEGDYLHAVAETLDISSGNARRMLADSLAPVMPWLSEASV